MEVRKHKDLRITEGRYNLDQLTNMSDLDTNY